jgi:hypothetical protein
VQAQEAEVTARLAPISAAITALALALGASPVAASVTLGQVAPPNPPAPCSDVSNRDFVQPTVTSGATYVVTGAGTITSWSTSAYAGPSPAFTLKIFRKVGDPAHFQAVRHDGPHALAWGVLNTFTSSVPVNPGDILGLHVKDAANACTFEVPGELASTYVGDLPDGASAPFSFKSDSRANIAAVVEPSNAFGFGEVTRNRRKGSATLTVSLPGPGALKTSGTGVKAAEATATGPGAVQLTIKAVGKAKRMLNDAGKATLRPGVTYTPTGGSPGTQAMRLKLKKV